MFQSNNPSSGRLLLSFAKVIINKIVLKVVMNQFGHVAAYIYSSYWSVYSVQCRVRLLLVCVQCTVQSETVIGVCTVYSVE